MCTQTRRPVTRAMRAVATAALGLTLGVAAFAVDITEAQTSIAARSQASDVSKMDGSSPRTAAVFVKYDGVDGESKDSKHEKWIDVLSIDWGAHQPGGGMTGQSRRRGAVVVEDMTLTLEYEKSSPKLQEKCLMGEVIPKLEIELTSTYGGSRVTYLKYELKNVMVTSYSVSGSDGRPTVVIGNNFEEIKVTYTEYDKKGSAQGNVETEFNVEKGE
jgi:type VI secretion system secreted protein Hcp